ncbi:TonB family C-terminal domain-containing protein [Pseudomonas grimontii]|uniref:TonB family C-terminal domain-containing protein n=1 Tax=Pseudomonas grimontii TaxID=129847 RepID=A0ABY0TRM9_9PSED|nr:TonB family protein [Pseudomonas grimontii]SDR29234.1 TonB family C-terminal domain-containing protein [Pseudomonas grimontii]
MQRGRAAGEQGAWRRAVCALVLLLLLGGGRVAQAESPLLLLNLPAQDLEHALQAYSRATGMAVLVDRELTRGRRSISVRGRFTPQEALAMLLTGSGLMARYARSDAFTLQLPEVSQPPATRGAAARNAARINNSYATALQQAIETSLCRSPLTRPGSFRALVQVWVNPQGLIEHSRLVSSTGDEQRDEALVRSLGTARVERPAPSSLRQPVTLLLMPDTTGTRMECTAANGAWGG